MASTGGRVLYTGCAESTSCDKSFRGEASYKNSSATFLVGKASHQLISSIWQRSFSEGKPAWGIVTGRDKQTPHESKASQSRVPRPNQKRFSS